MTEPLKIAVVGGGPAGLLFAKLVAREHPNYRIDVFEQNPSSATYGFGIVLADVALDFLNTVAPHLHADLVATAEKQDTITLYHRCGNVRSRETRVNIDADRVTYFRGEERSLS